MIKAWSLYSELWYCPTTRLSVRLIAPTTDDITEELSSFLFSYFFDLIVHFGLNPQFLSHQFSLKERKRTRRLNDLRGPSD